MFIPVAIDYEKAHRADKGVVTLSGGGATNVQVCSANSVKRVAAEMFIQFVINHTADTLGLYTSASAIKQLIAGNPSLFANVHMYSVVQTSVKKRLRGGAGTQEKNRRKATTHRGEASPEERHRGSNRCLPGARQHTGGNRHDLDVREGADTYSESNGDQRSRAPRRTARRRRIRKARRQPAYPHRFATRIHSV